MWNWFRYIICIESSQWNKTQELLVSNAMLWKQHNNANVLVLGGRQVSFELAKQMVDEYIKTQFEGGRHQQRIEDIELSDKLRMLIY